jgi:ABC-type nitrate/sulfonate/bicarbonate transport system substrate-binding protein
VDRFRHASPSIMIMTAIAALAVLQELGWLWWGRAPALEPKALTIAMPVQVAAGAIYVAQERRVFPERGLDVTLRPFLLGKQALQAVLDGQADIALVADTPFMLAVLRGEPIAALGTVFESRQTMAIFARKDSGIVGAAALGNTKVATVTGTNAEYFLDTMLDVHGVGRDGVSILAVKPDQLVGVLKAGQVDAVTVWHPDLARLEQELGTAGLTIYGEDFFVYRFLIVGKKTFIDTHPVELERLLASIEASNALIRADPGRARALLGQRLGMAPALLAKAFNPLDFTLTLDQSLLLALSNQARWAETKEIVPRAQIPDFLEFIREAPLTRFAPSANKIIR